MPAASGREHRAAGDVEIPSCQSVRGTAGATDAAGNFAAHRILKGGNSACASSSTTNQIHALERPVEQDSDDLLQTAHDPEMCRTVAEAMAHRDHRRPRDKLIFETPILGHLGSSLFLRSTSESFYIG
jgi:hypothetical protein